MKGLEFMLIVAGVLLVWVLSNKVTQETFVPEFLDQSDVKRTAEMSHSSYEQKTNHGVPTPMQQDPIAGMETPFRVNMYSSYAL